MATPTLESLAQLGKREQRKPCKIGEAVSGLTAAERRVILQALDSDDEDVRRGGLRWLVQERNIEISTAALGSHRRGRCSCPSRA